MENKVIQSIQMLNIVDVLDKSLIFYLVGCFYLNWTKFNSLRNDKNKIVEKLLYSQSTQHQNDVD